MMVRVFYWHQYNGGGEILDNFSMDIAFNSNKTITFKPNGSAYCSLYYINSDGMNSPELIFNGSPSPYTGIVSSVMSAYTPVSYRFYGNVGTVTDYFSNYNSGQFCVAYNLEINEYEKLVQLYNMMVELNANDETMIAQLDKIIANTDTVETKLQSMITLANNYFPKFNTKLQTIIDDIESMLNETDADAEKTDEFASSSSQQSGNIDELNKQNKVDKTDIDSASSTVDGYVDTDAIIDYGILLSTFTTNEHILKYILIVLSIVLVSYVLFGKR